MKYPKSIQTLIDIFTKLPSVGPKTAERYVFYLLNQNPEELQKLAQAIAELKEKIVICPVCHSVAESSPCVICADKKRNTSLLCAVANTRDLLALESTGHYNGYYHCLGGLINTIEGIKPEQLQINSLVKRLKNNQVKEIILAFSPTLEGETTTLYLTKLLKPYKVKITRLARGLPSGATLEYADEITLGSALKMRNVL
ncbi:MAG: recombination mediator RecR [Planctomycetes bacterium]|jgi:recombination protein RecR|nr:recombination mediator RecR [Planctomycetota bacterium]